MAALGCERTLLTGSSRPIADIGHEEEQTLKRNLPQVPEKGCYAKFSLLVTWRQKLSNMACHPLLC